MASDDASTMGTQHDDEKERWDPADDPTACSRCGVYIGSFPGSGYCDPCAREFGVKPPMQRCMHCGQDAPQETMKAVDLSGPEEYYPEIAYFCRSCSGGASN